MDNRNILVAGLGLIGGSIAKGIALEKNNHVVGYDVNEASLTYAKENGIIDEIATDFREAAKKADVIFLASPITNTIDLIKELDQIEFDHDVIVSDACSVKGSVLQAATELTNNHIIFVGGHPMAGSHKKGIQAAKVHLFENAIYVLSPTKENQDSAVAIIKDVLKNTKSHFMILQPNEHDAMTGVVSHFPHLIASSLVHQARKWQKTHSFLPELAAGGFRDITRIASSNPELWQDIFYHNQERMSLLLDEWIKEMSELKSMIQNNDKQRMTTYLQEAKDYRDGLGVQKRGAVPSFYDIYVDIADQPGALATVVQILAEASISISNIRILEIREGMTGALRLSVTTKDAQQQSFELLRKHGYEVMIEE